MVILTEAEISILRYARIGGNMIGTPTATEDAIEGREMLTVQQVADYLQVHRESVRRWLRDGSLRGVNIAGKGGWRIRRDELERFIQELEERR